jgi:hypothetical protein
MLAWGRVKRTQSRAWSEWMTIGEGLLAGRTWAMQKAGTNEPAGKGYALAFNEWLRDWKLNDLNNTDRAKLLQLMEELAAVEEWRASLTEYERRNLNNPTSIWRKWKALGRRKRSSQPSNIERENDRLHGRVKELQEEVKGRVQELEQARARIRELEEAHGGALQHAT